MTSFFFSTPLTYERSQRGQRASSSRGCLRSGREGAWFCRCQSGLIACRVAAGACHVIAMVIGDRHVAYFLRGQLRAVARCPAVPAIGGISLLLRHGDAGSFGQRQFGVLTGFYSAPTIRYRLPVSGSRNCQ